MTATFATLAGARVVHATLHVPGLGAWVADVGLDAEPPAPITGAVDLVIGDLTLKGTVVPAASGTFAAKGWYRIVGGGAGWTKLLPAKGYHNDAGIKAALVLGDAAREAGETLGTLPSSLAAAKLPGVDFVRQAGPAARVFATALGPSDGWWVDYAGVTQFGTRATSTPPAGAAFDLLNYYPDQRLVVLATETPSVLPIGTTISSPRLAAPLTIRELELTLTADTLRIRAWVDETGVAGALDNRMMRALRTLIRESLPTLEYLAPARYRVVQMQADGRADLQAVTKGRGFPDMLSVRLGPGMAGESAELTPGATVIVQFIEGNPGLPLVTHYATKEDAAFAAVTWAVRATEKATIDAPLVFLGEGAETGGQPAARLGEMVAITTPPTGAACTLTIGPLAVPAPGGQIAPGTTVAGFLSFPAGLFGSVQTGSSRVKAS